MEVLDIIILVVLGISVLIGAFHGFIRQLGSLAGLLLGIWLATKFSVVVVGWMASRVHTSETVLKVTAFASIMILTLVGMSLLGKMLEKIFTSVSLGWLNRLAGVLFSLAAGTLILGVVLLLLKYVDGNWFSIIDDSVFSNSRLAGLVIDISEKIFPFLKEIF